MPGIGFKHVDVQESETVSFRHTVKAELQGLLVC